MTTRPALVPLTVAIVVAVTIACGDSSRNSQTAATAESTQTGAPTETGPAETRPSRASSPAPAFREIVIPAGTVLKVRLERALASDSSRVEDAVRATLDAPVSVHGDVAIPDGAALSGSVLSVQRSGQVKGRASLAFRFERLSMNDEEYDVQTERISRQARATKKKDAQKIGIGAGAGALVGAIAGGGKGAAIGSAIGAGAGTGVVLATRGEEVRLPAGTTVTTKLVAPLAVHVPTS